MSTAAHGATTGFAVEHGLTVFLSNYNHGRFLAEALNALLGQSVRPGRIFVVDDASTDNSRVVIEQYARKHPDIIQAQFLDRNRGFVTNAIDWLASDDSEFVLVAAADDKIGPALFEKSLALLRRFPQAGLCSACARLLDENGADLGSFDSRRPLAEPGYLPPTAAARLLMRDDGWFMGNTTVYRGTALRAVGFDRELGAFADGFACRVIALQHGACFIPEELGFWRRMTGGMASQATMVPSVVNGIAARAETLMTGAYGALFPAGYAKRWRGRWLFWAVAAALTNLSTSDSRRSFQKLLTALPAIRRRGLMALPGIPRPLAILAAFALLRPFDLRRALQRRLGL